LWLVEEGRAEVFAVPKDGSGGRTHLWTAVAGQALCELGTERSGQGLSLLAVGHPGTRLRRLSEADLREIARDPAAAADLSARLDAWISGLFGELARAAAPRAFEELRTGGETRLEAAGRSARPREGVAWVRHLEGGSLLLGEEALALENGDLVPVPEGLWLVSAGEARLSSLETGAVLQGDGLLWRGLARFHDLCLDYVALQAVRTEQRERERLGRKVDLDRSTLRGAYARLASVLQPVPGDGAAAGAAPDPLLATVRVVGEAQGIAIRALPDWQAVSRQGDRLGQICAASRVRSRRVILRDDWWRRDNGPLIGFRFLDPEQKQRRPVALIPTSPRSYEMADPVEGTRTPVDTALAESLSGDAHMLYPPLPERSVTRGDLLRLAVRGRRGDLLTIVGMGAAGGLLGLLIPILTGQVFGNVIPGADRSQLGQITLALIVSALATSIFQVTRSVTLLRLGGKADGSLQSAVWDRLLSLPVSFFRRFSVGDLANRSLGINTIREMLTGNVLTSVLAAVFSVFSFGLLFYYSRRLALVATALVAVLALVT
ncbi:MAG TPA: ABC transporter transmembrane domain-containing protein, partial [Thermoanaerobaculia bacterium]|nr:ABC transporter transmembrane domain-containing protein [Thermoanaerobaculia bacterium]